MFKNLESHTCSAEGSTCLFVLDLNVNQKAKSLCSGLFALVDQEECPQTRLKKLDLAIFHLLGFLVAQKSRLVALVGALHGIGSIFQFDFNSAL